MYTQQTEESHAAIKYQNEVADAFVDTLITDVLGGSLAEVERALVLGDPPSLYDAISIWYNDLPATDQQQVISVARLAMTDALYTVLALFDDLKYLVDEGISGPGNNILRYGVYSEVYAATVLPKEGQHPLSQVAVNPWGDTKEYLCRRLAERLVLGPDKKQDKL